MLVVLPAETTTSWGSYVAVGLTIAAYLLSIVYVAQILRAGGRPAATLNWILVIILAPVLGLLLYYLLPRRLQRRHLQRRAQRLAWIDTNLDELRLPSQTPVAAEPLTQLMQRLDPDSVQRGNRLTLLPTGQEALDAGREAIAGARRFVHLQTYIFRPDATGLLVLQWLTEAAARGVEVRLLYDSIGSWSLAQRHLAALHAAGGRSAAFLPLLWRRRPFTLNLRNHRKLMVVDGDIGFVGGRNVGDEYAFDRFGKSCKWFDIVMQVEGPAVTRMNRVFVEDWYTAAEEDLARPVYFPEVASVGDELAGIVDSGPDARSHHMHYVFFQLLAMAKRSVRVSSPYLIPNPTILTALKVAAARGVRVQVHTNGRDAEAGVLYRAKRGFYRELLGAGVEVVETVGDYNHSKMIVVDDEVLFLGSPNLDVRSEELNFEVAVVARDSPACAAAVALFEQRCRQGRRVEPIDLSGNRAAQVVEGLCRLVTPLL